MTCPSALHDPLAKIRFPGADKARAIGAFRKWIESDEAGDVQVMAIAVLPSLRLAFLAGADYEATYQLSKEQTDEGR